MKKIFYLLLLVSSFASSQTYNPIQGKQDFKDSLRFTKYKGVDSSKVLGVDSSGNLTLRTKGSGSGSPTWGSITGTLSSQTDLSASLAGKKDKSDTSSSPGGYTTLYRNNLKMDSTTIRNDTVFNWHNGIRVFGFKIIASGTPDLLAVTSVDSATPHALLINGSILRSTNGGGSLFWGFRSGSGLDPGDGNTGVNVFGVGTSAATNNTANGVFVVGFQAGKNNSGGNTVGIGSGAANGNSGHDINAFGNLAGQSNTFNIVNLFGPGATADADKQNVYSDGTFSLIESFTGMTHNNKITKPDSTGTYILRINGQSPNSKGSFATTLATQQALQDSASAIRAAIAAIPGGSTPAGIGMNTGDGNMNMGGDIGTTVVDVRSSVSDMGFYLDPNGRFMQIGTSGVHGDFDIDNDLVDLSSFGKTKLSGVVSSRGVDYLFPLSGGPGALVNDGSNNLSWAPILSEPPITAPNTSKKYWTGYKTFGVMNSDTLIEGSANLFFTNTRARSAISLTTTGTGAATYNSSTGLLNIPTTGGGGSTNTSIGSGIKIAVDGTNNIKSVHAGSYIIIDSTSNSNEVTYIVDTASLFADFPRTTIHVDTTTLSFSGDSLSVKQKYKVYNAILTQSGTDAPVATVFENTLGGTVVWSYNSAGNYNATLVGAFPAGKVWFSSNAQGNDNASVWLSAMYNIGDGDSVQLFINDGDGTIGTSVEIRVYP